MSIDRELVRAKAGWEVIVWILVAPVLLALALVVAAICLPGWIVGWALPKKTIDSTHFDI